MASRVVMPKLTDTMVEGLIIRWHKQEGDRVESGDPIAEIETDKAVMDLEAYASGVMRKILVPAESTVPAGALIAVIGRPDEDISDILNEKTVPEPKKQAAPKPPEPAGRGEPAAARGPQTGRLKVSPRALHLATDSGVDLSALHGSGPDGIITERDVRSALESGGAAPSPGSEFDAEPLSPMRATIASRMTQSKQTAPHFYVTVDINMDNAVSLKERLSKDGTRVTVTDILIRAAALTLREFPQINAAYGGRSIRRYRSIHIGIAVGLEDGILTPVIRDADRKSVQEIATESRELIGRAKSRKISPSEYTGSTFSISNLGMFEVEHFIAIVQPGEAAVLAVGAVRDAAVVSGGKIMAAKQLKVTLSCDHRVIDGLQAARFLQAFKHRLEEGNFE
jgi:pyruvate dehydrogenase E2 component (dihydrolipoamide acetyltransferase)